MSASVQRTWAKRLPLPAQLSPGTAGVITHFALHARERSLKMRADALPDLNSPVTVGLRETWLSQAASPSGRYDGLLETGRPVCTAQTLLPGTTPGDRTIPAAVSDPCLWFPCANSPLCVDLFGIPLADSSLYARCQQCTSLASAFCEGSRVAFSTEALSSVACGACCRCMSAVVRRAQWSVITGESISEISSLVYGVTMLRHHNLEAKEAPAFDTGATSPLPPTSAVEGALRNVQCTQSDAVSLADDAEDMKTTSRPLKPQLSRVSSKQAFVRESTHPRRTARPRQLRCREVRLAAEQRSVVPFFFYVFQKACQAERHVVRDLWLYLQFSAAGTRPVRLWKQCKRCCARHPVDVAVVGKGAATGDEQVAKSCLPGEGEGPWWGLARTGPDGLCGCSQTAESEVAELTRRKGESACAHRERMYLLALQRWLMGNDLKAMGEALIKVTDESPEDLCALTIGTSFLLVAGEMHMAVRICTRPKVIKALGHCPFFWSLLAFAADQSALPRNVAETLSYRAARLAVTLCPSELHAHHALLHIFLVKGYLADSLRLAQVFHRAWARPRGFMQHHLWWHVAIVLVEMHQFRRAMQLFWTQVYPPEKQEGWDNHNGALQLLLRLKILHSWSVDFCADQLLRVSDAGSYCATPRLNERSTRKNHAVKVVREPDNGAGALAHDMTSALYQVLLRIRMEEEKTRNTSHTYRRSHAKEDKSCNSLDTPASATPSAPATFLRGPSAVGLSIACYIAALALATSKWGVSGCALAQASTPACGTADDLDVASVARRTRSQCCQTFPYRAATKQADEELRKLQEEVVPFLNWRVRSSQGQQRHYINVLVRRRWRSLALQTWLSAGKAFKAWADGDFATSAKLLHPLLRQDLAACASREKIHHCPVSVTQAERGNVTPQAQKELVEEAVFAARDAEHKASLHRRGNANNSPLAGISCLEHLCASREQAEIVVLIFLDAFYRSKKSSLNRSPRKEGEAVRPVFDNAVDKQIEKTVSNVLGRKLATDNSASAPLLHMYIALCNSVCALVAHDPAKTMDAQLHRRIACEIIQKYAEEEVLRDGRLAWA